MELDDQVKKDWVEFIKAQSLDEVISFPTPLFNLVRTILANKGYVTVCVWLGKEPIDPDRIVISRSAKLEQED